MKQSGKTHAQLFIVESLNFENEKKKEFEGRILSEILALSGKRCEYYYIRTEKELRRILHKFTATRHRYLHISCHAGDGSVATTLDNIPMHDFARIVRPHLKGRRLFLSACSLANSGLADLLMPASGCFSMLGPARDVYVNDATILWASLYHLMFAWDSTAMKGPVLRKNAHAVS